MAQEFAEVYINDGPQHQHIFIVIWEPVSTSHKTNASDSSCKGLTLQGSQVSVLLDNSVKLPQGKCRSHA